MKRVKLCDSGPELSSLSVGAWKWHTKDAFMNSKALDVFILKCIDLGITTFDHAEIYGNYRAHKYFGKAIKGQNSRSKIEIVTKCGIEEATGGSGKYYKTSRESILKSVENSLADLQTEYVDLLLIHRPSPFMNMEEVAETFALLKKQGKALHFGVSNFTVEQFKTLHSFFPISTNQLEISITALYSFSNGDLDLCQKNKLRPMAWSPLSGGSVFLSGQEREKRILKAADKIGAQYDLHTSQVLLAWLLSHPAGIIPVLGTTNIKRIEESLLSLGISLTEKEWFELWTASTGETLP